MDHTASPEANPAPDDVVVETSGLTKIFRPPKSLIGRWLARPRKDVLAVDRVDLAIRKGEIFGLVGPNGAGKTTLIKMLTTLVMPTSGQARVGDYNVVQGEMQVRRLVGLVTSNERSFYWRLTGRQNLEFFASLYQIPRAEAHHWVNELLDLLDLSDKGDDRFDSYSTGMRQRLAMARGLLSKPSIIFMDEPTKGVDPIGAAQIIEMIRGPVMDLWKPTVLITSHNLTEIQRLCKRIALLHHGRVIACGDFAYLHSLASTGERYSLAVRKLSVDTLACIARDVEATMPINVTQLNGASEFDIELPLGRECFPRLIRAVVSAGGDVLKCTSQEASFDEVFHTLIENNASETNGARG